MEKATWGWFDVAAVFGLRIVFLFILLRFVAPIWYPVDYLTVQIIDSLVLILLVSFFLRRHQSNLTIFFQRVKTSFPKQFFWGIVAGVGLFVLGNWSNRLLSSLLLADLAPHPLVTLTLEAKTAREFLLPFLIGGFLVPVAEEFFYRGFFYSAVKKHLKLLWAILFSALFFTVTHFNQVWLGEIFLVGVVLTWLYHRFHSLIPGIVAHIILNSGRLIMIYLAL